MATLEELEQKVNAVTQQLTQAINVINDMEADLMGAFSDITNSLTGIVDRLDAAAQQQAEATRIAGELQAQALGELTAKINDLLSANSVNHAQAAMEADHVGAFSDITNSLTGIVDRLDVAAQQQAEATRAASELQVQALDTLTTKMDELLSANGVNLAQAAMGIGNIVDYWKSVGWAELNKVKNFNQAIEKIEQKIDVELVQAKTDVVAKFRSML